MKSEVKIFDNLSDVLLAVEKANSEAPKKKGARARQAAPYALQFCGDVDEKGVFNRLINGETLYTFGAQSQQMSRALLHIFGVDLKALSRRSVVSSELRAALETAEKERTRRIRLEKRAKEKEKEKDKEVETLQQKLKDLQQQFGEVQKQLKSSK